VVSTFIQEQVEALGLRQTYLAVDPRLAGGGEFRTKTHHKARDWRDYPGTLLCFGFAGSGPGTGFPVQIRSVLEKKRSRPAGSGRQAPYELGTEIC